MMCWMNPPASDNPRHPDSPAHAALIVGCGYLGKRLAQQLIARGLTVFGTTRGEVHAKLLAGMGVRPLLLELTQPLTYASLTPALSAETLDVFLMIPPGRMNDETSTKQIMLCGTAHVIKALKRANVRKAVMVSSSAVYGQTDGQRVDADTPAEPNGERAMLMLEGEKLWLDGGDAYSVLRLAGLYGPGRIVGMRALRQGSPLLGNPDAMLNLVHVQDAVDLLLAMVEGSGAGRIELGCDGHPVGRLAYYTYLANRLNLPVPQVVDDQTAATIFGVNADRLARSANKSLDNTVTRKRTGWSPAFTDYKAGLEAILKESSADRRQSLGGG